MDKPTEIVVESVRDDDYGNRWVMPQGGGAEIKLGEKRPQLHELFQLGNIVSLEWGSYRDKDYVADAKLVSGEPKTKAEEPPKPVGWDSPNCLFDAKTDDIHNQVAYKIAGQVFGSYVRTGAFAKFTPTEIAVKIGVIAKEIKATMEMKIEETDD